jgi:hypothetical protein
MMRNNSNQKIKYETAIKNNIIDEKRKVNASELNNKNVIQRNSIFSFTTIKQNLVL